MRKSKSRILFYTKDEWVGERASRRHYSTPRRRLTRCYNLFYSFLLHRYPFIACEVIACEVWGIFESALSNIDMLEKFWEFLDRPPPLNPVQASYFAKVIGVFLMKKTGDVSLTGIVGCYSFTGAFQVKEELLISSTSLVPHCRCFNLSNHGLKWFPSCCFICRPRLSWIFCSRLSAWKSHPRAKEPFRYIRQITIRNKLLLPISPSLSTLLTSPKTFPSVIHHSG